MLHFVVWWDLLVPVSYVNLDPKGNKNEEHCVVGYGVS